MTTMKSYPISARFFHWTMALLIISMLCLGASMIQSLAVWQPIALSLHKSFGVLVLLLVALRLLNRLMFTAPSLPADISNLQALAARATHLGLYGAMITMPLSGWLMQNADGRLVNVFGWFNLPVLISANIERYSLLREVHGLIAWALVALIVMHVAAALYHGIIRRDHVLTSMTFSCEHKNKE